MNGTGSEAWASIDILIRHQEITVQWADVKDLAELARARLIVEVVDDGYRLVSAEAGAGVGTGVFFS